MPYIADNTGQFTYFDTIFGHPTWKGKTILDFGGNVGNILLEPGAKIEHDKYWCLDVDRDAIDIGQKRYPQAHFVFYNCYNREFNPNGVKDLSIPEFECRFDYILSVSALGMHIPKMEILPLIDNMNQWLKDDGVLAFTFVHPHHIPFDSKETNLEYYVKERFLKERFDRLPENKRHCCWYTLTKNEIYVETDVLNENDGATPEQRFMKFYTPDFMRSLCPRAEIFAPVRPLRSHCCVLRRV